MRDPYTKRTLLLASEMVKETAKLLIDNAPLDVLKPIQVTIGEASKARGLDANGYYWQMLNQIAEQGWFNGKRFDSDTWHEYAKRKIMPDEITTKDGIKRSKWTELPDGTMTVISTTQLEKSCFSEYTTLVEVFGAQELGVRYSVRPA